MLRLDGLVQNGMVACEEVGQLESQHRVALDADLAGQIERLGARLRLADTYVDCNPEFAGRSSAAETPPYDGRVGSTSPVAVSTAQPAGAAVISPIPRIASQCALPP